MCNEEITNLTDTLNSNISALISAICAQNCCQIEKTSSPVFGLFYNLTDDTYKRIGKNINYSQINGFNEFTAWRSNSAERQNDNDIIGASPLTNWLDNTANLPYSGMKRYIVDSNGTEVKAYNADSYTHSDQIGITADQQIMVKIPAFHYIQAKIVDGGKTFHLYAIANSSFEIDLVNDLGLTSPTITLWNPAIGISSGTVNENIITSALHPAFITDSGASLSQRYYGAFNAVNGRSICGNGVKPTSNITIAQARTQSQSFGTNFNQLDWFLRSALIILALIENGSFYFDKGGTSTQNKWDGYSWNTSASANNQDNGKTLSLLNTTGVVVDSSNRVIANSYRGIENYHSALWNWVDGVNIVSNIVYLAKPRAVFDDSSTTTNGYFSSTYTLPSNASGNYTSDFGAGTFIPTAIGATSTSCATDAIWAGNMRLIIGGAMTIPYVSGLCTWASNNPLSHSAWGIVARSAL